MSKFINNFKNFFSKKTNKQEVSDKINFDEIRSTLKDSLTSVKDLGFDIKMINYSFEPITLRNLSLEIIIRPNTGNYDFSEFMSELQNSISHIEYSDMDVKMDFDINLKDMNRRDLHFIHTATSDLYQYEVLGTFLKDVNNFSNVVSNNNIDIDTQQFLKKSVLVKLDITGEYESNNS